MSIGMIVTAFGVIVAGLAGILGVWMERDPGGPKSWALVFSALIVGATCVEMTHAIQSQAEGSAADAKMAVLLGSLSELAAKGDNPALSSFVGTELAIAARANPSVVKKMEANIAKKGGDPSAVMATAKAGRRQAVGLSAEPPKAGEKPKLASKQVQSQPRAAAVATEKVAALTDALPAGAADLASEVLGAGSVDEATAAALAEAEAAAAAARAEAAKAKQQAEQAVADAKAQAEQQIAQAKEQARAEAEAKVAEAKAQAEAKVAEAQAEAKKMVEEASKGFLKNLVGG